ncbi:MAG: DoxX family protein [bacterium]|nr:DoxX family protein [bacterium]
MTQYQKASLFLLRITMGWMFFYAGITKVVNPEWSAAGYLKGAKSFVWLYEWFLSPAILPIVNFMNEWGLTLLGVSFILGIVVRLSSTLGALLMLLYYLPILDFPYPNPHSFIVDEHIIYIAGLLLLGSFRAGRFIGLEKWCSELPICASFPQLRKLLG